MKLSQILRKECVVCDEFYMTGNPRRACCSNVCSNLYGRKRRYLLANRSDLAKKVRLKTEGEKCYTKYKSGARKREIRFRLTLAEFMRFLQKSCTYCDTEIKTIGLDRINNDIGYLAGNIQPCCTLCNWSKRTQTSDQFIAHCVRVANKANVIA